MISAFSLTNKNCLYASRSFTAFQRSWRWSSLWGVLGVYYKSGCYPKKSVRRIFLLNIILTKLLVSHFPNTKLIIDCWNSGLPLQTCISELRTNIETGESCHANHARFWESMKGNGQLLHSSGRALVPDLKSFSAILYKPGSQKSMKLERKHLYGEKLIFSQRSFQSQPQAPSLLGAHCAPRK